MTLTKLENLLKTAIGLDASTIGTASVERAIRQRVQSGGFESLEKYWDCVSQSPTELQELIEAVVIPETWFFREAKAFSALEKIAREEWMLRNGNGGLRLLSVPCASGEEPYSMAMCLRDVGLSCSRFQIEAIDISHYVLARARRGVFGKNSFRGADLEFRQRYFKSTPDGFVLDDSIRQAVRFEQGNLLQPLFGAGRSPYDVIFCRNLLIYFDAATQKRAVATLQQLLTPNGYLFCGPSESSLLLENGFVSAALSSAFAFQKVEAIKPPVATPTPRVTIRPNSLAKKHSPNTPQSGTGVSRTSSTASRTPVPTNGTPSNINLEVARHLADQGKFEEAADICHACLHQNGPSGELYYLLALIQEAAGKKDQAREFYRKAIYLEPNHYEALVHFALLLEALGDHSGARVLRERAERIKQSNKP